MSKKIIVGITAIDGDNIDSHRLGTFFLENKKIMIAKYDVRIIYVNAKKAEFLKKKLHVQSLPILNYENRIVSGLKPIIEFFMADMFGPQEEEEEFSMHNHIMSTEFDFNNGMYIPKVFDEKDSADVFKQNLDRRMDELNTKRGNKTVALPKEGELERQHNSDFESRGEISDVTQDDLDYEKWLEDLKHNSAN